MIGTYIYLSEACQVLGYDCQLDFHYLNCVFRNILLDSYNLIELYFQLRLFDWLWDWSEFWSLMVVRGRLPSRKKNSCNYTTLVCYSPVSIRKMAPKNHVNRASERHSSESWELAFFWSTQALHNLSF